MTNINFRHLISACSKMDNLDIVSYLANFADPKLLNGVCKAYYQLLKNRTSIFAMLKLGQHKLARKGYPPLCYKMEVSSEVSNNIIILYHVNKYFKPPKSNRFTLRLFKAYIYYSIYEVTIYCNSKFNDKHYLIDLIEVLNLQVEVRITGKPSKFYSPSEFIKMSLAH